jgi:hypothetical protein
MAIFTTLVRIVLAMARHARGHRKVCLTKEFVTLGDLTVAVFALCACLKVRLMTKENEFRQFINSDPRDSLFVAIESAELLDRCAVFLNGLVAGHALRRSGNPHRIARVRHGMAIFTDQPDCQMLLVAVRQRLVGRIRRSLL